MTKLFMLLLVAFATLCCVSCSDDDDDKNKDFPTEDPNDPNIVRTITLTVDTYSTVEFTLDNEKWYDRDYPEISVGKCPFPKDLSVDWGDGSVTSSNTHKCEISGKYNIVISAKDLKWFSSGYDDITAIDLKRCNSLVGIDMYEVELRSLDVAGFTELKYLKIIDAHLETLNANGCEKLVVLDCSYNELTSLDVSGCTALTYLDCFGNELTSSALNQIFEDLPQGKTWTEKDNGNEREMQSTIEIRSNPGTEDCDKSIAENKGWKVID